MNMLKFMFLLAQSCAAPCCGADGEKRAGSCGSCIQECSKAVFHTVRAWRQLQAPTWQAVPTYNVSTYTRNRHTTNYNGCCNPILALQPKQLYTEAVPLALQRLLWAGVTGSEALAAQQAMGTAQNSAPDMRNHAFAQSQSPLQPHLLNKRTRRSPATPAPAELPAHAPHQMPKQVLHNPRSAALRHSNAVLMAAGSALVCNNITACSCHHAGAATSTPHPTW